MPEAPVTRATLPSICRMAGRCEPVLADADVGGGQGAIGWDCATLQTATDALWQAELRTGAPEAPVTRATLTSICQMPRRH